MLNTASCILNNINALQPGASTGAGGRAKAPSPEMREWGTDTLQPTEPISNIRTFNFPLRSTNSSQTCVTSQVTSKLQLSCLFICKGTVVTLASRRIASVA
jgi:hypothetical protein